MREKYLRCKISLLLLGLAVCLAAKTDPSPATQQSTKAVLCCASQSDKSASEKSSAPESKYYLETLQFDAIKLELAGHSPFPLEADRPFTLRAATSSGPVVIRFVSSLRDVARSNGQAAEPGVRLTLDVAGPGSRPPFPACAHLSPSAVDMGLDAASIVDLLGSPKPFTLIARGNHAIAIYPLTNRQKRNGLSCIASKLRRENCAARLPNSLVSLPNQRTRHSPSNSRFRTLQRSAISRQKSMACTTPSSTSRMSGPARSA